MWGAGRETRTHDDLNGFAKDAEGAFFKLTPNTVPCVHKASGLVAALHMVNVFGNRVQCAPGGRLNCVLTRAHLATRKDFATLKEWWA